MKKKNKIKEIEKTEYYKTGIMLEEVPVIDRKYYNILHLCLNGGLNALILISSIMSVMSAFDIKYNKFVFILAVAVMCLIFSSFYLKIWWKLAGYIGILVGFVYGITNYTFIIRGGFGTIANAFMEVLEVKLDLPIERRYDEYVNNKIFAVTLCLIFIAGSLGLLLNIAINETKGFVIAFVTTFPFVQIGMYLGKRMDVMISVLYFSSLVCLIILRNSRYYKMESKKHKGYSAKRKKNTLTYDYVSDPRNSFSVSVMILTVLLFCAGIIGMIFPRATFRMNEKYSVWKDSTTETAKRFAIVGFWGMLNPSGSGVGGISRNELGSVDRVNLSYEKQLGVTTMVIPQEEYIYLRAYTGTVYEDNRWKYLSETGKHHNLNDYKVDNRPWSASLKSEDIADLTYNILKIDDEKKLTDTMKSIYVENVFANIDYTYLPYNVSDSGLYCKLINDDEYDGSIYYKNEIQCFYYHLIEQDISKIKYYAEQNYLKNEDEEIYNIEKAYRDYVYDTYLDVPEKNQSVISEVLREHDINEEDGIVCVDKVVSLFENEYEYTLMPGKTPSKKDFVNYFLSESKKGYCTYFASSAVLMFRSLGIPARYVGGYMFDTTDNDTRREAYYRAKDLSYNDSMNEGVPYIIDVTDADAHAWVEVYVDYLGWVRVEVTPGSFEESSDEDSALNQLLSDTIFNRQTYESLKKSTIVFMLFILSALVLAVILYIIISEILYLLSICRAYRLGWKNSQTFEHLSELLYESELCSEKQAKYLVSLVEASKYSRNDVSDEEKKMLHSMVMEISDSMKIRLSVFRRVRYLYLF